MEEEGIEIYIRPSGDNVVLKMFIPTRLREQFIDGIRNGCFDGGGVRINFEMHAQSKWATNCDEDTEIGLAEEPVHMRFPIDQIITSFEN